MLRNLIECFSWKDLGNEFEFVSGSTITYVVIIACMHFSTLNVFEVLEVLYVLKFRGKK